MHYKWDRKLHSKTINCSKWRSISQFSKCIQVIMSVKFIYNRITQRKVWYKIPTNFVPQLWYIIRLSHLFYCMKTSKMCVTWKWHILLKIYKKLGMRISFWSKTVYYLSSRNFAKIFINDAFRWYLVKVKEHFLW